VVAQCAPYGHAATLRRIASGWWCFSSWTWEREASGGVVSVALSLTRIWNREARTMQQRLYWLDYDAVALAVLVIGMGMIALLTLII
jgi:hypothetical protein